MFCDDDDDDDENDNDNDNPLVIKNYKYGPRFLCLAWPANI